MAHHNRTPLQPPRRSNGSRLDPLFNPKGVAVIGASERKGSVGASILANLKSGGYTFPVYAVNPKHAAIQGLPAYPSVSDIDAPIDLAVIATPAMTVPEIIHECGRKGIRSAVVVSAGFREAGAAGRDLERKLSNAIKDTGISVLGPNCLGFIRPSIGLNASFARKMALDGSIAFLSQSGALCSAILDWSLKDHVGFSAFVSMGEMLDIGFHDLIDHLGKDPKTKSILIYMETLSYARAFLSAAREFTFTKPIIVLKVGRSEEGAKAALSHTGSITGNDRVFDAAFERAGILRVRSVSELFDCAKALSMQQRPKGEGLAILTNAGGPGVIATDTLKMRGGALATLQQSTVAKLDANLPPHWSKGNPVDVLGDADSTRYADAADIILSDEQVAGLIIILTPQAVTDAIATATSVVQRGQKHGKTMLAAWMGEDDVSSARDILEKGGVPAFNEPEDAVRAFVNMVRYNNLIRGLYLEPEPVPAGFKSGKDAGEKIIANAIREGRRVLLEPEAKALLAGYGISVPAGGLAKSVQEAGGIADDIGYPVAMKIVSPDILHKVDVGGVALGVFTKNDVEATYRRMNETVRRNMPNADIRGVYVEEMVSRSHELLIGSKYDPIFGPSIVFGSGGTMVEVMADTNVAIPPLTMAHAKRLMENTKIYTVLKGFRGQKPVRLKHIRALLATFSELLTDLPMIGEMDLNPVVVDEMGETALDVKVVLLDEKAAAYPVRPIALIPRRIQEEISGEDGSVYHIRPIEPDEEDLLVPFASVLKEHMEHMGAGEHQHDDDIHGLLVRYAQPDYDRLITFGQYPEGKRAIENIGVLTIRKAQSAILDMPNPISLSQAIEGFVKCALRFVESCGVSTLSVRGTHLDRYALLFRTHGFVPFKGEDGMYAKTLKSSPGDK